jgi:hypothetical protein
MSAARFVAATASLCLVAAVAVATDAGGGSAEPAGAFRSLRPQIRSHPIPYSAERKSDMAAYAKRHYGMHRHRLRRPRVIVEHIAVAGSARAVWNTFAPNRPDPELHELPGLCTHFVVSARGRIQQLVPLKLMCRHTVGLNYTAIGIEHVGFSDGDLLGNRRQLRASLRLTRWLRCSRGIRIRDVIGHNESLRSPYHRERVRRLRDQTHGDMKRRSMRKYRRRLRARPCPPAPAGVRAAGGAVGRAARRVVGRSVQGRRIRAFRIGDPSSSRKALVVGSMHGNEPAGLDVVRALRRSDVRGVDVWVVPTVNPDGLRAGSRQNSHGVDLNRNFPYRWRLAGSPWSQYYSGPRPFSEPETRAVRRLTRELRPRVSIWYHQPWGHVVLPKRSRATRRVARRYARIARFPAHRLHGRRARLRGTAVSWQKHVLRGRAAFVVELAAGSLSRREMRRHARAALKVARGGSG